MSTLIFKDLSIESCIGELTFLKNATHLILEFSFNGRNRAEVKLEARQSPCEFWEAKTDVEVKGSPAFVLISVWMELDENGHRLLLGFKGLNGRDIYKATGNIYEAPLTCHQKYPCLMLETRMLSDEIFQNTISGGRKRPSNEIQEILDTAFKASRRFDRYGDMASLEEAISNYQNVIKMISKIHPNKPVLLSNLGACLGKRFRRLGNLTDLDGAVASLETAVHIASDSHSKSSLFDESGCFSYKPFRSGWKRCRH